MASPFPGMDPYLELSGDWRDFHARLLNALADELSDRLPEGYIARIEEEFHILEYPQETTSAPNSRCLDRAQAVPFRLPSHHRAQQRWNPSRSSW